jgi:uncharacterized protein involved in exopolysaccharide biosynthesis
MTTNLPTLPKEKSIGDRVSIGHEDGEMPLIDILIGLAERKRIILSVTAAFFILSIVVSLLLPKQYTATTVLIPPQQNSGMSAALASQLGSLGGFASLAGLSSGIKNPNDMFVTMLKSRTVEEAMVQRFDLTKEYRSRYISDARREFESRVKVDGDSKDGLINIAVEDSNPSRAAELANGYVEEFRKLSDHLAITEASQRRLFFEHQLETTKDNLAQAEEKLRQTEQETGLIQLDSQARALIESAASLRAQIAAKEVQIQAMETYATGENAQYIESEKELEGLRAQLAKLGGPGENSDAGLLVPKGKVPEVGLEYIRRLRDVKYYETIFEIIARQFEAAKLDEAKQGALIQVVDAAVPPDKRSFPKRGIIVVVSTFIGFLVGILVALFQNALVHLRKDPITNLKLRLFRRACHFGADKD